MTSASTSHGRAAALAPLTVARGEVFRVDSFVARVLARCGSLRLGVARSASEREAVFRLRYQVVIEEGWGRPSDFVDGLERDVYDDKACQIAVWDGDLLVATTRLVEPKADYRLPTEEAFGFVIQPRGRAVDVGRTCVSPGHRDRQHRVLWALLSQTWLEMRARGYVEACGVFNSAVVRLYRSMGLQVEILGPSRWYWGEERYPVLVQPAKSDLRCDSADL